MQIKKSFTACLFSTILFSYPLYADVESTITEEDLTQEHVEVGSKELDQETKALIRERRAKEHSQEASEESQDKPDLMLQRAQFKIHSSQSPFMLAPARVEKPQILSTAAFPVPSHHLASIADNDRSFELEDGSHWELSYSDSYILKTWSPGDLIKITPNYSWFSSYNYYITNKTTNTYVQANLSIGPFSFGPNSNWIIHCDAYAGHVSLQNNSIWCVHPRDQYLLKSWAVNDHIIIGIEESFWSYYDHILINVNMDEYVRAKQY